MSMNIKKTGKEMATQDNRATQYPLFVIQEDVQVFVEPGEDFDERERLEDTDDMYLCEADQKHYEEGEDLIEDCDDCDPEAYNHYRLEARFLLEAGVFLTAKACIEHISENSYHYRNPRSFGVSAWRNPEMQAVQRFLITNAGEKVPSHYQ